MQTEMAGNQARNIIYCLEPHAAFANGADYALYSQRDEAYS